VPLDAETVAPTTAVPDTEGAWFDTGAVAGAGVDGDEVVVVVVVVAVVVVGVGVVVVVPVLVVVAAVVSTVDVEPVVVQPGIPSCLHGGRLLRATAAPDATPASVTITRAMAAAPLVRSPMQC
jgi:hypothetical protein